MNSNVLAMTSKLPRARAVTLASAISAILLSARAQAVELPKQCVAGTCGNDGKGNPVTWVTSGAATSSVSADTLRINQTTNQAIFNWQSFNVSADGHVVFQQPNSASVALNKIYQQDPSSIFGQVTANGQIYLVNPNGLIFGATARVNAAGILASTLNISDNTFQGGLLTALQNRLPALSADLGADGKPLPVKVSVQQGAVLSTTGANSRLMLVGQSVENGGTLSAPDGQVILAAGNKVYLAASTDPTLRGLLVEVDNGGVAANLTTGQLSAARGDITMVGLAVNQSGRVSASTTVAANGSVHLLARDTVTVETKDVGASSVTFATATHGGTVTLGQKSRVDVSPELGDTATAVDDQKQNPSTVTISGQEVFVRSGAQIVAPGGQLSITAASNPTDLTRVESAAKIRVESGATIDLSGSSDTLPVSANIVNVELRANELKDSPEQRDGVLRGKTVAIDARVGTPLADVRGSIAAIPKNIAQRTSQGGTVAFNSTGDIVVAKGATINVSGGQTTFLGADVSTTQLITAGGQVVDIGKADPTVSYVGLINPSFTVTHDRWGVIDHIAGPSFSHFEPGYVQGASAGTVSLQAPSMLMSGTLIGQVVNGANQRTPTSMALGGALVIGNPAAVTAKTLDYRAPAVTFTSDAPLIVVADDASVPSGTSLSLSTDYLVNGGFTRTSIYSNDAVTLPPGTDLKLIPGSSMVIRANRVTIGSSIADLGGTLDFGSLLTIHSTGAAQRSGVYVSSGLTLDVRGAWINDSELTNSDTRISPLLQDAGVISLSAYPLGGDPFVYQSGGALSLGDDVKLLADGGAWLKSGGSIVGGKGGDISLLSGGQGGALNIGNDVALASFGVEGAAGGKFTLAAGNLQIAAGASWSDAQSFDPSKSDTKSSIGLGSGLFSNYGFTKFALYATGGTTAEQGNALTILANTKIAAASDTRRMPGDYASRPTGGAGDFGNIETPLPFQLLPIEIALGAATYPGNGDNTRFGALEIQKGAQIAATPGSTLTLSNASGNIGIDGELLFRGGTINARIGLVQPNALNTAYDPGLGIEVGPHALLDVSGTAAYKPSDVALTIGQLFDGGQISLSANRGNVLIDNGAFLNVSGISAPMDIATGNSKTPYSRQQTATNAGSISLKASESIFIDGVLLAQAGVGDSGHAFGGSLSVSLTRESASLPTASTPDLAASFPDAPRTVELSPNVIAAPINGTALLNVAQIQKAGFDSLKLAAEDQIVLDGLSNLSLGRQFQTDAPFLAVKGIGAATISAPYVSLGGSLPQASSPLASGGPGELKINAELIDLYGYNIWQGIGKATLSSSGDVRLRGVASGSSIAGGLAAAADLAVVSTRIYATTATQFFVQSPEHTLTITSSGAAAQLPLSAASGMHFSAADIVQNGTLLAPFGSIELTATNSLTLGAGSVTSVSGAGALIPYGQTQNNSLWVYALTGDQGGQLSNVNGVPARQVTLTGKTVALNSGATIDLSGGGDLYSYEWIPGTGGSKDALAATTTNKMFAILPSLSSAFAPFDTQEYAKSSLQAGDSVYLSGMGGLAAGYYALLPARYALLPGAYLITPVAGTTDMRPGVTGALADGTPIVAGYKSFADSGLGGARYSGFAVYPGSFGHALAQYNDHFASAFFDGTSKRIADAGKLTLSAGSQLDVQGLVKALGAPTGRGATIEVAATDLTIVGDSGSSNASGVQLRASVLSGWQASRLLLGGTSSEVENVATGIVTNTITATADNVSIAADARLTADEIIAVANKSITVSGSLQSASAAKNSSVKLPDDAVQVVVQGASGNAPALAAVSDVRAFDIGFATATNGGRISFGDGAQLVSRGALTIDAPGGSTLNGTLGGAGAEWLIGGSRISVGGTDSTSVSVSSAIVQQMQSASALTMASSGSIDFASAFSLGSAAATLGSVTFSANALNAAGADVAVHSHSIVLRGNADPTTLTPVAGTNGLTLSADNIDVVNKALALNGFSKSTLDAAGQITLRDTGSVFAGGDVTLNSSRVSAASASNSLLSATGAVQISKASAANVDLPALQLGGGITIAGASIEDNGAIVAPSGYVSLQSTGALVLKSGALIDVAGTKVTAVDHSVLSRGGSIELKSVGNFKADAGSILDVSGPKDGGRVSVLSFGSADLQSTLQGAGAGDGGSFTLAADSLSDFGSLAGALQTAGFSQRQSIRVGHGDLALSTGSAMRAHDVELIADTGSITIGGVVSAPSSDLRSSLRIYAGNSISLTSTGELHADADSSARDGGAIELGVGSSGSIALQEDGIVSAIGVHAGSLHLRAPAVGGNDIAVSTLASRLADAGAITLEAVMMPVNVATTTLTAANWNTANANAGTYMTAALPVVAARLNPTNTVQYVLQPGIEFRRNGDLTVSTIDLSTFRYGDNVPPAVTIRATGTVSIGTATARATVSDGFSTIGLNAAQRFAPIDGASASLRVVAGSNLSSADPNAVVANIDAAHPIVGSQSDLKVATNSIVRTGTGDLNLVAAHDIQIGLNASVYTGGIAVAPTQIIGGAGASASFMDNGGRLLLDAGRDITGTKIVQNMTAWQARNNLPGVGTTVGIDVRQFKWSAGTLGGGDFIAHAGRDISQFSAGAADGLIELQDSTLNRFGGGAFLLQANNNINSGMYFVGRGTGVIDAGNAVLAANTWTAGGAPQGLFLAMGDAQVRIGARSDVALAGVVNPTVLPQAIAGARTNYFFSYGEDSSLDIESVGGNIGITERGVDTTGAFFGSIAQTFGPVAIAMPGTLSATAFSGDIAINSLSAAAGSGGGIVLFPSQSGHLDLFAARDIRSSGTATSSLLMSDVLAGSLPNAVEPTNLPIKATAFNVDALQAIHAEDPTPISFVAGRDIKNLTFLLPNTVRAFAGRDIIDLTIESQNLRDSDVSEIFAGRDFKFSGGPNQTIAVGGPGRLDILAGGKIDLGVSAGVVTVGDLRNPNIPTAGGADLTLMAGIAAGLDVNGFIDNVVAKSVSGAADLISFVQTATGSSDLELKTAVTKFKSLSADAQRPFILEHFFAELVAAGRAANTDSKTAFKGGYAAIDALLPGNRGANNPYTGDINLDYSRIYTLGGGNINLFAPGGSINVGLANPPPSVGQRNPSLLGIVAQNAGSINIFSEGDVLVNQSRIFTLLGGDIAIWSTLGNIDAGRGAKSSLSAPAPTVLVDNAGNVTLDFSGAVAGSGIRTIITGDNVKPGNVDLIAPAGFVNAGDAGIGASGNLNIAAQHVIGLDNIQVGGTSSGVPPETSGLGASLSGAAAAGSSASNASSGAVGNEEKSKDAVAPMAATALSWLEVFVVGLGEDTCKQDDIDCLKRQKGP